MSARVARLVLAFTTGLFLACAAAQSAQAQNIIVPEMQYRLDAVSAARLDSLMPPLPDSVPTAHGWFRVHYVPRAVCDITRLPKNVVLDGCVMYDRRVIEVATDEPSLAQKWQTLKHEMAHVMFRDAGIVFLSGALEERACDVVATWAMMELLVTHLAEQP